MGKSKKGVADKVRKSKLAKASNVFKVKNNPFEVKINKQKHNILGRKTKHDRGLPGVSRSKANKKRKETLLKEYKDRHKSNSVVDERFGESNADMSVEDKMLQRFAMEKKRKHDKMSLFNLNDDEEDLTHFGQSLGDIKDFGDMGQSDEEDSGVISGEYVSEAHFGGGIFTKVKQTEEEGTTEDDRPKSKKEIIDEIIMKSKRAKVEKQNAKEEANDLREKLDDTWQEVEKLLKSSARTPKDKETAKQLSEPDAYDLAVKQMQYDRKAAPATREKSDAEKAAEEAARIRRLEDERLMRMQHSIDTAFKSTHRSADDLNYDFVPEKVQVEPVYYKDGVMVGDDQNTENTGGNDWQLEPVIENIDGMNEEDDNEEDLDREEASDAEKSDAEAGSEEEEDDDDDDDYSDILSEDEVNDSKYEGAKGNKEKKSTSKTVKKSKATEIISDFPDTYEAFLGKCETKHDGDTEACVSSLRKKYALGLAKGNKERLQKLFQYVWHLMYDITMEETLNIPECDKLMIHLYELCEVNPSSSAKYIIMDMKLAYENCQRPLLPDFGTLMRFKLIKNLFSTSDYLHAVVGPAILFMCHLLHTWRPANLRDVARCLFLCTLLYEYVCFSKRFVPECINCLCAILCMGIPKKIQQAKGLPAAASMYMRAKNCELLVKKNDGDDVVYKSNEKPRLVDLLTTEHPESFNNDKTRLQLLATTLKLSLQFVRLYAQLPCFKEVHEPLKAACTRCLAGNKEGRTKSHLHPLTDLLHELQTEIRRLTKKRPNFVPLVRSESNKPKMLPLYDPKFEDVCEPFQKNSRKKTSTTKREKERLQHKYKRELKGAMREIKKDARFLAREQLNEQAQKDLEREAKVKRLFGFLSNQEGEVKKINRKTFKLGVS